MKIFFPNKASAFSCWIWGFTQCQSTDNYVQQKRVDIGEKRPPLTLSSNHPAFHAATFSAVTCRLIQFHTSWDTQDTDSLNAVSNWFLISVVASNVDFQTLPRKKSIFQHSVDFNCERFQPTCKVWFFSWQTGRSRSRTGYITEVLIIAAVVSKHSGSIGWHTQKSQQANVQYIVLHSSRVVFISCNFFAHI